MKKVNFIFYAIFFRVFFRPLTFFSLHKIVTIHDANLAEARHQLKTQLFEQRAVDLRQSAEADDSRVARERKRQLSNLVDKLGAVQLVLRNQEEARERELAFKENVRQKRAAFQVRLARLEQRQAAER